MPKWTASSYFNVCLITRVCFCACTIKILEHGKDAVSWEYLNRFIIVRETPTERSQDIFIYISISCIVLSSHILYWDIETFILIILKSTALKNKSFRKTVHITKQPKPTWQIYMLHSWFQSEQCHGLTPASKQGTKHHAATCSLPSSRRPALHSWLGRSTENK